MKFLFVLFFLPSCAYLEKYMSPMSSSNPFKVHKAKDKKEFKEPPKAVLETRLQELESENMFMTGKQEEVEKEISNIKSQLDSKKEKLETELKKVREDFNLYKEELSDLKNRIITLEEQKESLREEVKSLKKRSKRKNVKLSFSQAQSDFKKKRWALAAKGYKHHLDKNPKSKYKTFSYYRIGYCFEKLNKKKEAIYFYKKAHKNNSKSKWGKISLKRSKKLK